MKKLLLVGSMFAVFSTALAQNYIFYLHGKIVENQGPYAVEQTNGYGAYLYYPILDSLKQKRNIVISEVRPKNTEVKPYASKIKNEIDSLLKLGVKPERITVIGASKGATIAMYVSTYLKNASVNFVFMAACYTDLETDINCYGNILSIYEKTDVAASCDQLKVASKGIRHYKEIELNTGLKHGFLFKPLHEWISPSLAWSNADYK